MTWRCEIDWAATAAWLQAIGSVAAIWAAGRVAVLQQRLAREQTVEGVFAAIGLAHGIFEDAAETARDHDHKNGWYTYDPERVGDVLAWIISATPQVIGNMRLVEIVSEYPPMLRRAYKIANRSRDQARNSRAIDGGVWEDLQDIERASAEFYAEAGRILSRVQGSRKRWLLW